METRHIILALALFCLSCNGEQSILALGDYLKYINKEENGLLHEHIVKEISIKLKCLPTDYLLYQDLKHLDKRSRPGIIDSLRRSYVNSLTFLMTIGPADDAAFDVTRVGVKDYGEYSERIEKMNFQMQQNVWLEVEGERYYPVLFEMESVYGLRPSRDYLIVFPIVNEAGSELLTTDFSFVYQDELFYTGINRFFFKLEDFQKIPALAL